MNTMKFTEHEEKLLATIFALSQRVDKVTFNVLENAFDGDSEENEDCKSAIESLITKGVLFDEDGDYVVSDDVKPIAAKILNQQREKGFSECLVKNESSEVYGVFCERLYGKNLSQFNMTPMYQLDHLLKILRIDSGSHILDLGCGIGRITEYVCETTNAAVTGLDFAAGAIQRARGRNKGNRKLHYIVGDMNNLQLEANSFDVIIAIDTVYFVEDLKTLIGKLKEIVKNGGQMGIFYDEMVKSDEDKNNLEADHTRLAKALNDHALTYVCFDYTEDEKKFWKKELDLAKKMKAEFEAAGELETYKARVEESQRILKCITEDRLSRHLYVVNVDK